MWEYETGLEVAMSDTVSGGATLAWRLLATLEGGSLVLATTALLAYTARTKTRPRRPVRSVLVTDTTTPLGAEINRQLENFGCEVRNIANGLANDGASGERVDALVIVGAQPRANGDGLNALADLVAKDIYDNMALLDTLLTRLNRNGYIAWACAGATRGSFSGAADAFDAALRASLQHAAKRSSCESIWVGRCETVEEAAGRVVAALMSSNTHQHNRFSIRNAANKVSGYIGRWLKIVT